MEVAETCSNLVFVTNAHHDDPDASFAAQAARFNKIADLFRRFRESVEASEEPRTIADRINEMRALSTGNNGIDSLSVAEVVVYPPQEGDPRYAIKMALFNYALSHALGERAPALWESSGATLVEESAAYVLAMEQTQDFEAWADNLLWRAIEAPDLDTLRDRIDDYVSYQRRFVGDAIDASHAWITNGVTAMNGRYRSGTGTRSAELRRFVSDMNAAFSVLSKPGSSTSRAPRLGSPDFDAYRLAVEEPFGITGRSQFAVDNRMVGYDRWLASRRRHSIDAWDSKLSRRALRRAGFEPMSYRAYRRALRRGHVGPLSGKRAAAGVALVGVVAAAAVAVTAISGQRRDEVAAATPPVDARPIASKPNIELNDENCWDKEVLSADFEQCAVPETPERKQLESFLDNFGGEEGLAGLIEQQGGGSQESVHKIVELLKTGDYVEASETARRELSDRRTRNGTKTPETNLLVRFAGLARAQAENNKAVHDAGFVEALNNAASSALRGSEARRTEARFAGDRSATREQVAEHIGREIGGLTGR